MANKNVWAAVTRATRKYWFNEDANASVKPPAALNNEALSGVAAAGTSEVDMIKVNASDDVELPNGAVVAASMSLIQTMACFPKTTVTTDATAGALTYTAAMLLGGIILRDPAGAGRSDVTPTATLLVAAIPNCAVGTSFEFTIRNTADAAETITVTAGTDCTLSGTMTIAQNNSKRFLVVVTNVASPAYTLYSLGTVVH